MTDGCKFYGYNCRVLRRQSVQLPQWSSNFSPGIKTKFKEFKKKLISQWEAKENFADFYRDHFLYQLCLKNTEIP